MSHTTIETRNDYENRTDNVNVTNGTKYVSIGITPGQEYGSSISTGLTPEQARSLAAALIEHAEDVEGHPYYLPEIHG